MAQWLVLALLAMLGGPTLLSGIQSEARPSLSPANPHRIANEITPLEIRSGVSEARLGFASCAPNLFQGGRPKRAASHRRVLHLFADSSRSP
jgi:hypothetical protein